MSEETPNENPEEGPVENVLDLRVSQAEIKEVMDLKEDISDKSAMIEAKVREGATVEDGDLAAKMVTSTTYDTISKKWLVEKLGETEANRIWAMRGAKKTKESFKLGKKEDIDGGDKRRRTSGDSNKGSEGRSD